jgi:hypothetical protein
MDRDIDTMDELSILGLQGDRCVAHIRINTGITVLVLFNLIIIIHGRTVKGNPGATIGTTT